MGGIVPGEEKGDGMGALGWGEILTGLEGEGDWGGGTDRVRGGRGTGWGLWREGGRS